jgi:hypothetical protein
VISRYAVSLDRGDTKEAVACFIADALVEYDSGEIRLHARDEMTHYFPDILTSPSTHLISQQHGRSVWRRGEDVKLGDCLRYSSHRLHLGSGPRL